MPYIGTSPSNGVRRVHTYTATASQTTFTGASSEGVTLSYADTNYIDVFQNGVLLGSADYTSTSGTSVVLAQGASVDDLVVIVLYDVFSVADTVSKTNGGSFDSGVTMSSTLAVTGNQTNTGNVTVNGAFTSKGIDDNASSTAMTIDSSGNIGVGSSPNNHGSMNKTFEIIGTSDVELTLHATSDSMANGARIGQINFSAGSDSTVPMVGAIRGGVAGTDENKGYISFHTRGTDTGGLPSQRMEIGNGGDVGIGVGSTTSYFFNVMNAPGRSVIVYFYATSGVGVYLSDGANSWSAASDENIKENITELNKQKSYDNIKNIRAINFNFKDVVKTDEDGKEVIHKDDTKRLGFIAQDWQKEYPEAIVKGPEDNLGLNYTETIPVLLSALQKAQEKIEALETRVTALENAE